MDGPDEFRQITEESDGNQVRVFLKDKIKSAAGKLVIWSTV